MVYTTIDKDFSLLPNWYFGWRNHIEQMIAQSKLSAAMHVNTDMLSLYWQIGKSILNKQKQQGWGKLVIDQLSVDLTKRFPDDRGYSIRNLHYMRRFADAYPDFPILQVPLAELIKAGKTYAEITLTQITWYHHISLLSKVKDEAERAYYIIETAQNGWSRDTMLTQITNGYINAKGHAATLLKRRRSGINVAVPKYYMYICKM